MKTNKANYIQIKPIISKSRLKIALKIPQKYMISCEGSLPACGSISNLGKWHHFLPPVVSFGNMVWNHVLDKLAEVKSFATQIWHVMCHLKFDVPEQQGKYTEWCNAKTLFQDNMTRREAGALQCEPEPREQTQLNTVGFAKAAGRVSHVEKIKSKSEQGFGKRHGIHFRVT